MAHALVCGMTQSGKTALCRSLAVSLVRAGVGVLVLHKPREPWTLPAGPGPRFQTADPEQFLRTFWKARNCVSFLEMTDARHGGTIDGERIDKEDRRFHALATDSRHEGHQVFFIAQRAAAIHPEIRENCGRVYCFKVGPLTAKTLYDETCDALFLSAPTLPLRHFLEKRSPGENAVTRPPLTLPA